MSDQPWTAELCGPCSSHVNASFIFAKQIYHPAGRPCSHVEPSVSTEPSEEAWHRFAEAQQRICSPDQAPPNYGLIRVDPFSFVTVKQTP